jgi:hypothetical protein
MAESENFALENGGWRYDKVKKLQRVQPFPQSTRLSKEAT